MVGNNGQPTGMDYNSINRGFSSPNMSDLDRGLKGRSAEIVGGYETILSRAR